MSPETATPGAGEHPRFLVDERDRPVPPEGSLRSSDHRGEPILSAHERLDVVRPPV